MKQTVVAAVIMAVVTAACWSPGKRQYGETFRMVETGGDSTIYGTCEEVRDSNMMLFVSDMGDTMLLSLRHAVVCGKPETENQLALMLAADGSLAKLVNITAMMGTWVEADPIDEGFETGISLLEGGCASSVNSRVHCYTNWHFHNGRLLMTSRNDMGGVMGDDIIDTFDIIKLEPDSLVIKGSGYDCHFSHPSDSVRGDAGVPADSVDYIQMLLGY